MCDLYGVLACVILCTPARSGYSASWQQVTRVDTKGQIALFGAHWVFDSQHYSVCLCMQVLEPLMMRADIQTTVRVKKEHP